MRLGRSLALPLITGDYSPCHPEPEAKDLPNGTQHAQGRLFAALTMTRT
jgi:hypothetical protein